MGAPVSYRVIAEAATPQVARAVPAAARHPSDWDLGLDFAHEADAHRALLLLARAADRLADDGRCDALGLVRGSACGLLLGAANEPALVAAVERYAAHLACHRLARAA